jgi:protoheme IX farnesyltransferase
LFTGDDITAGQEVFLKNGLMEYGSIFGHGAWLGLSRRREYKVCRRGNSPQLLVSVGSSMNRMRLYFELTKPRILFMVLVTTMLGFLLGSGSVGSFLLLFLTLLGVGGATGGAAVLNNYLERDLDAKMVRTRRRALPAGLIEPLRALSLGVGLVLIGVLLLAVSVNLLTGFLVLLAAFLYVLVYTPLKRITWWNTTFGAIPGAIPPMAGWAAATGHVGPGAWALFAILFAWQHPHFFAIAWMFRDDYRVGGFKMLPVIEPSGQRTVRLCVGFSLVLLGVSLIPTLIGMAGWFYFSGTFLIGLLMLIVALSFAHDRSVGNARRLLKASVLYLPLLLLFIFLDAGVKPFSGL